MASAFYWFPSPTGTMETISLGETLSDLQYTPSVNQSASQGLTGAIAQTRFGAKAMVRVVHERFTGAALIRDMYALEAHLKDGGLVAVAVDAAQTWSGFATVVPARGASTLTLHNHRIFPYGSTNIAQGQEIEIIGSQPRGLRETVTVASSYSSAGPVSLSESLRFDYREAGARWVFVRHIGFWPLLRLPPERRGDTLVTHEHGIAYTFDAQLEEAIDILDAFAGVPNVTSTTTTVTGSRFSAEEVNRTLINPTGNGLPSDDEGGAMPWPPLSWP